MNEKKYKFIFSWILIDKLALGNSPLNRENINLLKENGIKNILALCSDSEIKWGTETKESFLCERFYIPDSKSNSLPTFQELNEIINKLSIFIKKGATFIHCFASIERSPLICILYVMKEFDLEIEDALDYVLRKHKYTNPTNSQLKLIKDFQNNLKKKVS